MTYIAIFLSYGYVKKKKVICSTRKIFLRHFPFQLKNNKGYIEQGKKVLPYQQHMLLYLILVLLTIFSSLFLFIMQRPCAFHPCPFVRDHMVHDPKMQHGNIMSG